MTVVRPFRALRYDPKRVDFSRVIAPPYDVIAPEERSHFFDRDPHNAIRLELTRRVEDEASTDYAEVRSALEEWWREGVLIRDEEPALYGLRQRFTAPDGTPRVRDGFFAALQLEEFGRGVVRPHERTLSGPKADRLKILRAARANLSSIFLLYEDRERALDRLLVESFENAVLCEARAESGVEHTLSRIDEPSRIDELCAFLAERPTVIADGHHRYETALAYRQASREATARDFTLAYFANAYAPGSLLLPIHRLIRKGSAPTAAAWTDRLPGWEHETVSLAGPEQISAHLAEHLAPLAGEHAFAADDGGGCLRIFRRSGKQARAAGDGRGLAIQALHEEVIGGVFGLDEEAVRDGAVAFLNDAERASREVRGGQGAVALFVNPLTPDDVFETTAAGHLLPQKSTYFHPKLPSGLVFRPLEEGP